MPLNIFHIYKWLTWIFVLWYFMVFEMCTGRKILKIQRKIEVDTHMMIGGSVMNFVQAIRYYAESVWIRQIFLFSRILVFPVRMKQEMRLFFFQNILTKHLVSLHFNAYAHAYSLQIDWNICNAFKWRINKRKRL